MFLPTTTTIETESIRRAIRWDLHRSACSRSYGKLRWVAFECGIAKDLETSDSYQCRSRFFSCFISL